MQDTDLRVGVIASTHGIRGEVKVFPTTDDPQRFKKLKRCYLVFRKEEIALTVESVRFFKQFVIVKFKEYSNINDIERFVHCDLFVAREDAIPLEEDEYYVADLIGHKVITDEGEELGELVDVLQTAANDVYQVQSESGEEVLIPVIPPCIISHNMEAKVTVVHLLPGLRN